MKFLFAFGFLPVPVFYTDNIPAGSNGEALWALWPFIRVRPICKDDMSVQLHELTHCEQMFKTLFLHTLLYKHNRAYRQRAEVAAYRVQIAARPAGASIEFMVQALAHKYDLGITEAAARAALT